MIKAALSAKTVLVVLVVLVVLRTKAAPGCLSWQLFLKKLAYSSQQLEPHPVVPW